MNIFFWGFPDSETFEFYELENKEKTIIYNFIYKYMDFDILTIATI